MSCISHPSEAKYCEFKKLKTDRDKRSWLATFILDPKTGGCSASSHTTVGHESVDETIEIWVTAWASCTELFTYC